MQARPTCKGLRSGEQSRGIQEVVFDRKLTTTTYVVFAYLSEKGYAERLSALSEHRSDGVWTLGAPSSTWVLWTTRDSVEELSKGRSARHITPCNTHSLILVRTFTLKTSLA